MSHARFLKEKISQLRPVYILSPKNRLFLKNLLLYHHKIINIIFYGKNDKISNVDSLS